jgi:hypothetical protein
MLARRLKRRPFHHTAGIFEVLASEVFSAPIVFNEWLSTARYWPVLAENHHLAARN